MKSSTGIQQTVTKKKKRKPGFYDFTTFSTDYFQNINCFNYEVGKSKKASSSSGSDDYCDANDFRVSGDPDYSKLQEFSN